MPRRKVNPPPVDAAAAMAKYIASYQSEEYLGTYARSSYILDVLYGLGVSLSAFGSDYKNAAGFDKFKAELRELLESRK